MLATDSLFMLILLTSPVDTEIPAISDEALKYICPSLVTTALQLELLDPHEVRYFFTKPEDFRADLSQLRARYRDLVEAPPLSDADRFPNLDIVSECLTFNRTYRRHIEFRQTFEPSYWRSHQTVLEEIDQLYQIWDEARQARCDQGYVPLRRRALERLRELVGPERYYSGHLPPVVPIWRFQPIH